MSTLPQQPVGSQSRNLKAGGGLFSWALVGRAEQDVGGDVYIGCSGSP